MKTAARAAVATAIREGRLLHPSEVGCVDCGDGANAYHHWAGYAAANRLSVVPLCDRCHTRRHRPSTRQHLPPERPPGWMPIEITLGPDQVFLEEAAAACGVPYERLRKAVQRGGLPAEKLRAGRTTPYVVRLEDVRAYLATVRRGPKKRGKEG